MMYSNKNLFRMAVTGVARTFFALNLIFLGAGNAFSDLSDVYITGGHSSVYVDGGSLYVSGGVMQVEPNTDSTGNQRPWYVSVDLGNGGGAADSELLGQYLEDMNHSGHALPEILTVLRYEIMPLLLQQYNVTGILDNVVNIRYTSERIADTQDQILDALRYSNGTTQTYESVAKILADIRDQGVSGGLDLGVAFTNLVGALSFYSSSGYTNMNTFLTALNSDDGSFARQYGLEPLFYNSIYDGLPYYTPYVESSALLVPNSWIAPNSGQTQQNTLFNLARSRDTARGRAVSNMLQHAAIKKYDGYGTYQSRLMLSNLFYNANMVTWTNQVSAGINPNNFALQWFDSYNTKFQNMLLEYGTYAAITNENKPKVEFAKNWYESYSPRILLDYLINTDLLTGTNSLAELAAGVSDSDNSYARQNFPTWGMNTNSASIDMGTIHPNVNTDYKTQGDEITEERKASAEYLNKGWTVIDTIQDNYEDIIDVIISKVHESGDGSSPGDSPGNNGLSLRVPGLNAYDGKIVIQEQYIDFSLPSGAKDKLTDFWSLIKKCLEWGMWTWAFFSCWGLLCGSDFKQSSPTILD